MKIRNATKEEQAKYDHLHDEGIGERIFNADEMWNKTLNAAHFCFDMTEDHDPRDVLDHLILISATDRHKKREQVVVLYNDHEYLIGLPEEYIPNLKEE